MPPHRRAVKPFFDLDAKPRKPLFNFSSPPPQKQKPLLSFFNSKRDEDLDFIMDTYQTGLSPFPSCEAECKTRSVMLKKIARKRYPHKVPILEQIENIVDHHKKGHIDTKTAIAKLLAISEKHGDRNLHNGILARVGAIAPQGRPQRHLGIFAAQGSNEPHPIAKFLATTQKKKKVVKIKKQKTEKRIENPIATFFDTTAKRGKSKGWDPWRDEHPLATMMKKQTKKQKKKRRKK